jgi:tetratricopeptide (TPR) repeat protein
MLFKNRLCANPDKINQANATIKLARALVSEDTSELAWMLCRNKLAEYPDNILILNELARMASDNGYWDDAYYFYRKVLAINPDHAYANNGCGKFYYMSHKYKQAKTFFTKALENDKNNLYAKNYIIKTEYKLGNIDIAEEMLLAIQEDFPEDIHSRCLLGKIYLSKGFNAMAKRKLNVLYKFNNENPIIMKYIAELALSEGDFIEAEKYYQKFLNHKKLKYHGLKGLGKLALLANQGQKAKEYYTEILTMYPSNFSGRVGLGYAELMQRNLKLSEAYFSSVCEDDQHNIKAIIGLLINSLAGNKIAMTKKHIQQMNKINSQYLLVENVDLGKISFSLNIDRQLTRLGLSIAALAKWTNIGYDFYNRRELFIYNEESIIGVLIDITENKALSLNRVAII